MKTIKQIADDIGVSKQAVFYRIKKPPLSNALQPFMTNENGILTISLDGETLIKQAFDNEAVKTFGDKEPSNTVKDPSKESTSFDSEIIQMLKENMAVLQKQLETKDKLIEDQQQTIKELNITVRIQAESINAAHHNELAETLIDSQATTPELPATEKKEKQRPFWQFWKK